jgi:ABC-type dipeptide/oligopeptide/nickel transport system permease component
VIPPDLRRQELLRRDDRAATAAWGLNDPVGVQYLRHLRNMLLFDFGNSFFQIERSAIMPTRCRTPA